MIIHWKGARLLALSEKTSLMPGINIVADSEWKGYVQSKGIKRKMKTGQLELIAGKVETEPLKGSGGVLVPGKEKVTLTSKDPWKLEPNEALRVVELTLDIKTLEVWQKNESREEIRLAILQQIDKMKK